MRCGHSDQVDQPQCHAKRPRIDRRSHSERLVDEGRSRGLRLATGKHVDQNILQIRNASLN